jgi:hypothetical protein
VIALTSSGEGEATTFPSFAGGEASALRSFAGGEAVVLTKLVGAGGPTMSSGFGEETGTVLASLVRREPTELTGAGEGEGRDFMKAAGEEVDSVPETAFGTRFLLGLELAAGAFKELLGEVPEYVLATGFR